MAKNLDKIFAIAFISSVFLGVGGYSLGMTYGRSVERDYLQNKNEIAENETKEGRESDNTQEDSSDNTKHNDSDAENNNNNTNNNKNNTNNNTNKGNTDKDDNSTTSSKLNSPSKRNAMNRRSSKSSIYKNTRYNKNRGRGSAYRRSSRNNTTYTLPKKLKDGSYEGSSYGYQSDIRVKVDVKNNKIKGIRVLSHNETPEFYIKGHKVVDRILSAQTPSVDAVSGATYTSNAIKKAVSNALSKAGYTKKKSPQTGKAEDIEKLKRENEKYKKDNTKMKSENEELKKQIEALSNLEGKKLKDGKYEGSAKGFKGNVYVSVEVKGGKIANVEITGHQDDAEYFDRAKNMVSSMVSKNTPNVDSISGATFSSLGIKNAVRNALAKAGLSIDANANNGDLEEKLATSNSKIKELEDNNTNLKNEVETLKKQVEISSTSKNNKVSGKFKGSGKGFRGKVDVNVELKEGKITGVEVLDYSDDEDWFEKARKIIDNIVSKNSPNVDSVSGATYSSNGIKSAVVDALSKANSSESDSSNIITELKKKLDEFKKIIETLKNEIAEKDKKLEKYNDNNHSSTGNSEDNSNNETRENTDNTNGNNGSENGGHNGSGNGRHDEDNNNISDENTDNVNGRNSVDNHSGMNNTTRNGSSITANGLNAIHTNTGARVIPY